MFSLVRNHSGRRLLLVGKPLALASQAIPDQPDWVQARPDRIQKALKHASQLPSGGWYVLGISSEISDKPMHMWIDKRELVAWRAPGGIRVAPNTCPHMGAPLSSGRTRDGRIVCPWHGLELGEKPHGKWQLLPVHDDGIFTWVQLPAREQPSTTPVLSSRPSQFIEGVIRLEANCDPMDVIANRLDPWHGAHYHPHSFARLKVLDIREDVITLRVAYRILGPVCVEVDATFHCPEPRTIVMTIVSGEGLGSVVETHATPMKPGWTAISEATLATSDRPGFHLARLAKGLTRALIERSARRLWREDAAYAERTYSLRAAGNTEDVAKAETAMALT